MFFGQSADVVLMLWEFLVPQNKLFIYSFRFGYKLARNQSKKQRKEYQLTKENKIKLIMTIIFKVISYFYPS